MEQSVVHQRSFRMPLKVEVTCIVNENEFQGKVCDMSATGFFMETTICPPIGSKCNIQIILNGDHSRLTIDKLGGIVKRCEDRGVGIELDARLEWVALVSIYFQ
jgi:hypothetical protein